MGRHSIKGAAGRPRVNLSGLQYGTGSLQQRGRVWWLIYKDPEGKVIQENSHLEDEPKARRLLAERALVTARARVEALREIIHEPVSPDVPRGGRN